MRVHLQQGDCEIRFDDLRDVAAVVSDPPYDLSSSGTANPGRTSWAYFREPADDAPLPEGRLRRSRQPADVRGFMGMTWDGTGIAFSTSFWDQVFHAVRPGGVVKVFGGTRTFHRMASVMSSTGFIDIHLAAWAYGSGFPKSLNVSKSFDKLHGAQRPMKRTPFSGEAMMRHGGDNTRPWIEEARRRGYHEAPGDEPVTPDAVLWNGWGTALKPSWEPVVVGRRP